MDFSLDPSKNDSQAQEQARIYQRQLYRPGQAAAAKGAPASTAKTSPPAGKTPVPATKPSRPAAKTPSSAAGKGTSPWPARWKKIGKVAAVLLGMFILGTISYAIFDDPVGEAKKARDAAFDRNLAPEERREKFAEFRKSMNDLTWKQKDQLNREWRQKGREKIQRFLKLTEAEQDAELQKQILEWEKRRKEMQAKWAARNKDKGKNGQNGRGKGGPPGGGWGGGRGSSNAAQREMARMDGSTPEDRAGGDYYRDRMQLVRQRMGITGGGRGGFPKGGGR